MTSTFKPPKIGKLASVDVVDCKYGSKPTEIVGVVSFGGQGGWPRTDDYDVHCFAFATWRRIGKPIVRRELTIPRPVAAGGDWFSEYPEGTIHRLRVLLSADELRAVFADVIERSVADSELKTIAKELKKPVTLKTDHFGVLTLNRSINRFEGTATWNGQSVHISFQTAEDLDIRPQLKTAEQLFATSKTWAKRINEFAVKEKLKLANEWRDEDTKPITAAAFLRRMTLGSISIEHDGRFEFWHNDGDMFYGHSIQISGSLKEGLTRSDIPG